MPPNGWTGGAITALAATVESIKTSIGQIGLLVAYNPNASAAYIQIFDALPSAVTLGTTPPLMVLPIGATSNASLPVGNPGVQFQNAISVAATTTATGSTAPGTALTCSYAYN